MRNSDGRDYDRIERAIGYLATRWNEPVTLAEVAAVAGLSPAHFDRMFTRWAGVSPMRFRHYMTKEAALERLRGGASVLDATLDVGLSGPGRLHDLLVTGEAVTPGEARRGGAGVEIRFGLAETPFGEALLAETARGICALAFVGPETAENLRAQLRRDWPQARLREDATAARALARRVFHGPGDDQPALHLRGTNFQLKVWRALLDVPPGRLTTYGALAARLGMPTASRAVGGAVGANAVSVLIPCHRVIRGTGVLGHYRWGAARKLALCGWEAARAEAEVA